MGRNTYLYDLADEVRSDFTFRADIERASTAAGANDCVV